MGETSMRNIILAMLMAAGLGLAGAPTAQAVPVAGTVIGDALSTDSLLEDVQYRRTRRVCVRWVVQWRHIGYSRRIAVRRCVLWRHR
jgi:hypothetical protein